MYIEDGVVVAFDLVCGWCVVLTRVDDDGRVRYNVGWCVWSLIVFLQYSMRVMLHGAKELEIGRAHV